MSRYRAERAAEKLLSETGQTPPVKVKKIAEHLGIVVAEEGLPEHVSGVLMAEEDPPIIAVNRDHGMHRQRFSIAHELGHYLLHRSASSLFVDANPVFYRDERSSLGIDWSETEANAFAAALLMPEDVIRARLLEHPTDPFDDAGIERLASEFAVSLQAMAIRLTILNLV